MKPQAARAARTALLALLIPFAAIISPRAQTQQTDRIENLRAAVANFQQEITALPSEDVNAEAYRIFNQEVPAVRAPRAQMPQNWRFMNEKDSLQKPASVGDLIASAQNLAAHSQSVPPPMLSQALDALNQMDSAGRINVDDGAILDKREMGLYQFTQNSGDLGRIFLNKITPELASLAGWPLACSTLVHEAYHRVEKAAGQLDKESVAAEVPAFLAQYDAIKAAYPTGQEIFTRLMELKQMMKTSPSPVAAQAESFVATMGKLFNTGGRVNDVRHFVQSLGYSDDGSKP